MTKNEARELTSALKYTTGDGRMFDTLKEAQVHRFNIAKTTGITLPVEGWNTVNKVSVKLLWKLATGLP
jgi:hypothetical protein